MFYTGYFCKIPEYLKANLLPIGIAKKLPSGIDIPHLPELGPNWSIYSNYRQNKNTAEYTRRYVDEILSGLLQFKIMEKMLSFRLTVQQIPILLCYEKPSDFCHRHIVAGWLNHGLQMKGCEFKLEP